MRIETYDVRPIAENHAEDFVDADVSAVPARAAARRSRLFTAENGCTYMRRWISPPAHKAGCDNAVPVYGANARRITMLSSANAPMDGVNVTSVVVGRQVVGPEAVDHDDENVRPIARAGPPGARRRGTERRAGPDRRSRRPRGGVHRRTGCRSTIGRTRSSTTPKRGIDGGVALDRQRDVRADACLRPGAGAQLTSPDRRGCTARTTRTEMTAHATRRRKRPVLKLHRQAIEAAHVTQTTSFWSVVPQSASRSSCGDHDDTDHA